jgi:hypothetical protein
MIGVSNLPVISRNMDQLAEQVRKYVARVAVGGAQAGRRLKVLEKYLLGETNEVGVFGRGAMLGSADGGRHRPPVNLAGFAGDCFLRVRRFDAFQARLGVTRHVLADRLKKLVRSDGAIGAG